MLCFFVSCGTVHHTSGKSLVAEQTILSPEQQRKYTYFFLEAIRLKEKEDYAAAFEMLQHCLSISPNAPSALYEMAQYRLYLRENEQGVADLEKAVANAPENYWYSQGLATLYQQQKQSQQAIDLLEQMSNRFPTKQEPLLGLMELYGQQKDYDLMISTLNRLEKRLGKNEQFSMEKFRIYLQMGDNEKAFQEIESLVKEYPMDMRYLVTLGDVYLQNGKQKEAYDIYQKVLTNEPDNSMALYSLATYYKETGQDELYKRQLDSLLLNKRVLDNVKLNVMRLVIVENERTSKDSTQVIDLFQKVMQHEVDDPQIPMLFAHYLISKQMKEEAVPVLRQVVDLDPTMKPARLMLVSMAVENDDYKQIIEICEPAIEAIPEALEFYFYLAVAYNQATQTDSVLSVCGKALEHVDSESPKEVISDFYAMMGDAYHIKQLPEKTYAAYDSALVYNPNNITALNNYAYYLSLERRELDKAEEMSYRTVKAEPHNATFLDTYAWILFVKGNYAEARIYIDNAMKADGEKSSEVVEHCADIYYMTGDTEQAVELWKQALELGSESKTLKEKIKQQKYIAE